MRTQFTSVTLDGINIQDNYIRTSDLDFLPNLLLLDQVAEVTVSTSNANTSAFGGRGTGCLRDAVGNERYPRQTVLVEPEQRTVIEYIL